MADFCKTCSIHLFGEDTGDFKGLITEEQEKNGELACVLCEGCGAYITVNSKGEKVGIVKVLTGPSNY